MRLFLVLPLKHAQRKLVLRREIEADIPVGRDLFEGHVHDGDQMQG